MLEELRSKDLLKVEAFVAWLAEHGIGIDRTLVSHWNAGRSHLPADLLPLLAGFTERADVVYGPYLRDTGYELVDIPTAEAQGRDLTDLVLECNADLGRLQVALLEARSPGSPGGEAIVASERKQLRALLDDLMHRLAQLRAQLDAGDALR
jgi:hypothetical protein